MCNRKVTKLKMKLKFLSFSFYFFHTFSLFFQFIFFSFCFASQLTDQGLHHEEVLKMPDLATVQSFTFLHTCSSETGYHVYVFFCQKKKCKITIWLSYYQGMNQCLQQETQSQLTVYWYHWGVLVTKFCSLQLTNAA